MALNRFMHPRNIYKIPPDFEKLTNTFTEFSSIAKMDAKGKVTIDFKDPQSLRVLTKCLLKSDFNLDVEIPEDRLVPTLPLRLNYVLWIEDLIAAIGRQTDIKGIDIGTGACAIYPLLAAVRKKWFLIGTEVDAVSLKIAQDNVERNNLQQLIQIKNNEGSTLVQNLFSDDNLQNFDFCMCNPPFYSTLQELCESRSPARLPPKNGFTGSVHELITEGGELEFCRKLIRESKNCKDNIALFTTMIGHKYNLSELLQDLKNENIKHTHTEFCQGRVTRWGLAWTYQNHDIYKLVPPREKPRKKKVPVVQKLPELTNCENNLENSYSKLKNILSDLKIKFKVLNKCGKHIALDIVANNNTWSNQRRRKRQIKRIEEVAAKKSRLDSGSDTANISSVSNTSELDSLQKSTQLVNNSLSLKLDANGSSDLASKCFGSSEEAEPMLKSKKSTSEFDSPQKSTKLVITSPSTEKSVIIVNSESASKCINESYEESEPLVQAFVKMFKKDDTINLETEFITGTGGKEILHQIVQFIKNNWK